MTNIYTNIYKIKIKANQYGIYVVYENQLVEFTVFEVTKSARWSWDSGKIVRFCFFWHVYLSIVH